jgi:hypothetical protein
MLVVQSHVWFVLLANASPPEYRNLKLEKFIEENKDDTKLDLTRQEPYLNAQDMQIIAYYAIENNKVRTEKIVIIPI